VVAVCCTGNFLFRNAETATSLFWELLVLPDLQEACFYVFICVLQEALNSHKVTFSLSTCSTPLDKLMNNKRLSITGEELFIADKGGIKMRTLEGVLQKTYDFFNKF